MLTTGNSVLLVVDIQGKLAQIMYERDALLTNVKKMIRGAQVLGVPIIWVEQNPQGLGPTVPEIRELLVGLSPLDKFSFSCCGEKSFLERLESLGRRQVLLAGIEAHVCIYQTAMDLLAAGYEVQIVADAVSSRTRENREIALTKMRDLGAVMTSTECALFELLRVAKGPKFKEILQIVK